MTTLTITARDFANLVKPVIPHAGRDESLPLLTTIRFETIGSTLYAMATDRFTMGIQRHPDAAIKGAKIRATVPMQAIRQTLATFKPTRNVNPELTFKFTKTEVKVHTEGLDSGIFGGNLAQFTFHLRDGDYPPIIRLLNFAEVAQDDLARGVALNPSYVARFAAAQTLGAPMVMHPARENKPVVVTVIPNFIGMIVPVRFADKGLEGLKDWGDLEAAAKRSQAAEEKAKAAA